MEREEALALLRLDEDGELASAEKVYGNLRENISRRLQQLPAESEYREELETALENFLAAIEFLRNWHASSEARPSEALDPVILHNKRDLPTADGEPVQYDLQTDSAINAISRKLAQLSPIKLYGAMAILLLATIITGVLLLGREDTASVSAPQPAPPTVENAPQDSVLEQTHYGGDESEDSLMEHQEELEQLHRNWRAAGDRLMDRQVELEQILQDATSAANVPDPAPEQSLLAEERLRLILGYVVNDEYLKQLDHALYKDLPSNQEMTLLRQDQLDLDRLGSDADSRLSQLTALDEAIAARAAVTTQIQSLLSKGMSEWPPDRSAIPELFVDTTPQEIGQILVIAAAADLNLAEGEFAQAAAQYRQARAAIAGLEIVPENIADKTELFIEDLYSLGREAITKLQLSKPVEGSALEYAEKIKAIEPGRPEAADLLRRIRQQYLILARKALDKDQLYKARAHANSAGAIGGNSSEISTLIKVIAARERVLAEEQFQPLRPVEEQEGIAMLTLPLGEFEMGSPAPTTPFGKLAGGISDFFNSMGGTQAQEDMLRESDEKPSHPVVIESWVAISRSEITVGQFRRFVEAIDFVTDAEQRGFSNTYRDDVEIEVAGKNWRHDYLGNTASPDLPVINVSHRDATAFANWLSNVTGASYRLPSESEYEYAARAGEEGLTPWGKKMPPPNSGNFRGEWDTPPPDWQQGTGRMAVRTVKGYSDGAFGPTAVGTYADNSFGLESLLGNVSEWVADCHTANYEGKGPSQHAAPGGNCNYRMVRGTDWATDARKLRLTYRVGQPDTYSSNRIGFRVARDVEHAVGG